MELQWRRIACGVSLALGFISTVKAQTPMVTVGLPGYSTAIRLDTVGRPRPVPGPLGDAFRATQAAFQALKIPITNADEAHGLVANLEVTRIARFAGKRISELLNCGRGMTGSNADIYRVTMAIGVFIEKTDPAVSRIRVGFVAGAEPVEGNSKTPVPCGSTGVLETTVEEFVINRLKSP